MSSPDFTKAKIDFIAGDTYYHDQVNASNMVTFDCSQDATIIRDYDGKIITINDTTNNITTNLIWNSAENLESYNDGVNKWTLNYDDNFNLIGITHSLL